MDEDEIATIRSVSGQTVTLVSPLKFEHIGVEPSYDGEKIPMKGEVGLLSRNVKFRGDPENSKKDRYGAHIMFASPGDETSKGQITYTELRDVG